jgi:predicted short-subunit dehydrogenase-like oxidoreductase (DUF2520 family)
VDYKTTPETLNVVGCGKLGRTMTALWLRERTFRLGSICNRAKESSERAVAELGAGTAADSLEQMPAAPVWMIATPDSEIRATAERLASAGALQPRDIVFHCSGALSSEILEPLRMRGASLGSLHPIRSFADPMLAVESFPGTYCALEGDKDALELLERACLSLQARVFAIDARSKLVCHAGHVFASNYFVALLDVAQRLYRAAGLPEDVVVGLSEPIVRSALDNLLALGPHKALTGPIVRGETRLVEDQIRALHEISPAYVTLYRELGQAALEIARERGDLPPEKVAALDALFVAPPSRSRDPKAG